MAGHDWGKLSQNKGLGAASDPRNTQGENNGDTKVIKMAGSGLGVGICKEVHENVMSHKHIAGDHKGEGGVRFVKVKFWPFAIKEGRECILHTDDSLDFSWSFLG